MERRTNQILVGAAFSAGLLATTAAGAASLQQLDQGEWWGSVTGLPSYVNMYLYVPDQRAEHPPIVVAPHHCQGTGPGTYSEMSGLVSMADRSGFIIIFPEATGQNCWDAGSDRSLRHDGKGDTHAIVQMVRYVLSTYDGNRGRVYSVGGSSGGIMTEALLGVYPDVFMAGVSLMGVPCGCWAEGYNDVVGKPSDGTGQWSGPCSGGNVTHTAAEWGDLVRSYFPEYTGHRPRLQHWHGTDDTVLSYANVAEDIKEWTNLLGLDESPTGTDTPSSGTTRQHWTSPGCDFTVYEVFSMSGVAHSVPFDANAVAAYFGLDDVAGDDPETAACPDALPGGSGSGGSGSGGSDSGGAAGEGQASEAGSAGDSGGATAGGGADGGAIGNSGGVAESATGGSAPTSGGVTGIGGSGTNGGTSGAGESVGGAVTTAGGSSATGGVGASGGVSTMGGALSGGGSQGAVLGTGGSPGSAAGGTSGTVSTAASGGGPGATGGGGQVPLGSGGSGASSGGLGDSNPGTGGSYTGGATASGPSSETGGLLPGADSGSDSESGADGCGCRLGGSASGAPTRAWLLMAACALGLARRRRPIA